MYYISSRNQDDRLSGSQAIVNGLSKDGGLYVPSFFPQISFEDLEMMIDYSYEERAAFIMSKFLDDFSYDELLDYTKKAYSKFYGDPCPLACIDKNKYFLELWHGPTCAFKDMALSVMPYLLVASKKKNDKKEKTLILVATSGDTGKAALEGYKNVEGVDIMVFYPSQGVSDMQKLQMMTQDGSNVSVVAIEGNFDDAQTAVKEMFKDSNLKDQLLKENYVLSSANSINWGRLLPQIPYYFSAYVDLLADKRIKLGDKINFCVPTGNFGNILASYYAKQMGLPINKLVCASNSNNILSDFFNTGIYDINRKFVKTISPSMDILISSNLERLLFEMLNRNEKELNKLMNNLSESGKYSIDLEKIKKLGLFYANYASEEETQEAISNTFDEYGYLMDPHTAVGYCVYEKYIENTNDTKTPTIIVSTANPYKFANDVYLAIKGEECSDALKAIEGILEDTAEEVPEPLLGLNDKKIIFNNVVKKQNIKEEVLKYVKK